ncbi:MAG: DUF5666 domain-containing protein [bacterium]|nr:DUF5666 domain-containing protein [bacterium]
MIKLVFTTLLVLFTVSSVGVVFGQDPDNSVESRAKSRLEEIERRLASKSAGNAETRVGFGKDHFVGLIDQIDGSTIFVLFGKSKKSVLTLSSTKYFQFGSKKTKIKLPNLKIGDRIAVYGVGKKDSSGTALLIGKLSKEPQRRAVFGFIRELNASGLVVNHIRKTEEKLATALFTTKTKIKQKNKDLLVSDLKVGDIVVVAGTLESGGNLVANLIYSLPSLAKIKISTASATPSAR